MACETMVVNGCAVSFTIVQSCAEELGVDILEQVKAKPASQNVVLISNSWVKFSKFLLMNYSTAHPCCLLALIFVAVLHIQSRSCTVKQLF